jgi:hypothetical protein
MEIKVELTRRSVLKITVATMLLLLVAFGGFVAGVNLTYYVAEQRGFQVGYLQALQDVTDKTGITFEWHDLGNGRYEIQAFYDGKLIAKGITEVHCEVIQTRDGVVISYSYHDGTLTTDGKNWMEDQLGDSPSTDPAKWIACSNTTDSASADWHVLPDEITTDGLARAAGSYASTGDGAWNITKTFSVSGSNSTVCYGLHWAASGENNLLCAENQGAGNRKNVNSGDTLKVTWQCSVT